MASKTQASCATCAGPLHNIKAAVFPHKTQWALYSRTSQQPLYTCQGHWALFASTSLLACILAPVNGPCIQSISIGPVSQCKSIGSAQTMGPVFSRPSMGTAPQCKSMGPVSPPHRGNLTDDEEPGRPDGAADRVLRAAEVHRARPRAHPTPVAPLQRANPFYRSTKHLAVCSRLHLNFVYPCVVKPQHLFL